MSQKKAWFTDRIGERVYRDPVSCDCDTCLQIGLNGIEITDTFVAEYLWKMSQEQDISYRNNKEKAKKKENK